MYAAQFVYSCIYAYVDCFHLLAFVNNELLQWTWLCKYLFKILLSVLLNMHLQIRFLDLKVIIFLIFLNCFSQKLYHFTCLPCVQFWVFHILTNICYLKKKILLMGVRWHLIVALICISLMIFLCKNNYRFIRTHKNIGKSQCTLRPFPPMTAAYTVVVQCQNQEINIGATQLFRLQQFYMHFSMYAVLSRG